MSSDTPSPGASGQSFLRRHGLVMLGSGVVSSILTVLVMLGVQGHFAAVRAKGLEAALLGKWDLVESNPPLRPEIMPEEHWVEFRADGTLRHRSISTVAVNGKVTDRHENLQVVGYRVVDAGHIVLGKGGQEHLIRVVLTGDELTLHKQFGGVERYHRAGG